MNYALILRIILSTMNLVGKIAESRGYEGKELEDFIDARNALREEIVAEMGKSKVPGETTSEHTLQAEAEDDVITRTFDDIDTRESSLINQEDEDEAEAPSLQD